MTASVLKQDPNAKRFKRTLISFNTDTQYAHFQGNPLYQATKQHLTDKQISLFGAWKINANNLLSTEQAVKTKPKQDKSFSFICHRF